MTGSDPFLGIWKLIPGQSTYEHGTPPTQGIYKITSDVDDYIFEMEWTTPDGQEREMSFRANPDSVERPYYDNPDVADTLILTRIDYHTLDSEAKKNGAVVAYARRILSEDGQHLTVSQEGKTPDGEKFKNVAVYVKVS